MELLPRDSTLSLRSDARAAGTANRAPISSARRITLRLPASEEDVTARGVAMPCPLSL